MHFLKSFQQNKNLLVSILTVSLILIIGQWLQSEFLFDRDAINKGHWWKILTGNFTHSNIPHLLLNLSGLWLLALLFIDSISAKTFILTSIVLSLVVGFGLYLFTPELSRYYGFSGALYGLYFVAAICAILAKDLFTGISVALLISGKIMWDYITGGNQSSAELIGIPVANDAHLYGFIGAIVISGFLVLIQRFNNKKRTPPHF